jgi:hypothetical protein
MIEFVLAKQNGSGRRHEGSKSILRQAKMSYLLFPDKGMDELGMMFLVLLQLGREKKLRFARTVRTVLCLATACRQPTVLY